MGRSRFCAGCSPVFVLEQPAANRQPQAANLRKTAASRQKPADGTVPAPDPTKASSVSALDIVVGFRSSAVEPRRGKRYTVKKSTQCPCAIINVHMKPVGHDWSQSTRLNVPTKTESDPDLAYPFPSRVYYRRSFARWRRCFSRRLRFSRPGKNG